MLVNHNGSIIRLEKQTTLLNQKTSEYGHPRSQMMMEKLEINHKWQAVVQNSPNTTKLCWK